MKMFGIGDNFANSVVKSINNVKGNVTITLESGEVFTREEVERVIFYVQNK